MSTTTTVVVEARTTAVGGLNGSTDIPNRERQIEVADAVSASLNYFTPPLDGSKPWENINADPATGINARNFSLKSIGVSIENIRGKEDTVSLDTAGFGYYKAEAKHKGFRNDEEIEREYYPESEKLLKRLTGASRVVIWDHTVRRRRPGQPDDHPSRRQPVPQVHTDQTRASSIARVHRHLPPPDVPSLLTHRFQIINLWRPINHPANDHPLALCDYRSLDVKEDLVPTTLKFPDREGETYSVKYNPSHRWKYVRGMKPDEVVLIKCFDSIDDGSIAVLAPHTAFDDPTTPPDAPLRESIELRTLVFYD